MSSAMHATATCADEPPPMIYVAQAQAFMPRMWLAVRTAVAARIDHPGADGGRLVARRRSALVPGADDAGTAEGVAGRGAAAGVVARRLRGARRVPGRGRPLRRDLRSDNDPDEEYGIRLALGASGHQLRTLVMGQTMSLVIVGLLTGLVLAALGSRVLGALLFEVNPLDAVTYVSVTVLLTLVGVLTALWPARRAARSIRSRRCAKRPQLHRFPSRPGCPGSPKLVGLPGFPRLLGLTKLLGLMARRNSPSTFCNPGNWGTRGTGELDEPRGSSRSIRDFLLKLVPIAAAERKALTRAQDDGVIAGARQELLDAIRVDDMRAMNADEARGVQPVFHVDIVSRNRYDSPFTCRRT